MKIPLMRFLTLLLGLIVGTALADSPSTFDEPGTDHSIKPNELTVFWVKTFDKGEWPEGVNPADPNLKNRGRVKDEDGLYQCRRSHVWIVDQDAGGIVRPNDRVADLLRPDWSVIPKQPDATSLTTCAYLSMQIKLDQPEGWGLYGVVCPRRVLGPNGNTTFEIPKCPMDCVCIDGDPIDM